MNKDMLQKNVVSVFETRLEPAALVFDAFTNGKSLDCAKRVKQVAATLSHPISHDDSSHWGTTKECLQSLVDKIKDKLTATSSWDEMRDATAKSFDSKDSAMEFFKNSTDMAPVAKLFEENFSSSDKEFKVVELVTKDLEFGKFKASLALNQKDQVVAITIDVDSN